MGGYDPLAIVNPYKERKLLGLLEARPAKYWYYK